jgi:cobalt-zinc-cadmium efflux system protein
MLLLLFLRKVRKMSHSRNHSPNNDNRTFAIGVILNLSFVAAEVGFGIYADSLALLADAGHNLSDVLGLLLAWGASFLSRLPATQRRTYGWRSSTIMAALLNALLLMVAVGGIAWEAIRRLQAPQPAAGSVIIVVAAIGVGINTATALLFMAGRKKDLNIRGAFLHMAADAGVSAGVVAAGIGIMSTGWLWLDPAVSLMIAGIILLGTWGLLRESVNLILHAVPSGIDPEAVLDWLGRLPGVTAVHDLHIWAMSTTDFALTAHLVKPDPKGESELIGMARKGLHDRFGITHVTLQLEREETAAECSDSCCVRPKIGKQE